MPSPELRQPEPEWKLPPKVDLDVDTRERAKETSYTLDNFLDDLRDQTAALAITDNEAYKHHLEFKAHIRTLPLSEIMLAVAVVRDILQTDGIDQVEFANGRAMITVLLERFNHLIALATPDYVFAHASRTKAFMEACEFAFAYPIATYADKAAAEYERLTAGYDYSTYRLQRDNPDLKTLLQEVEQEHSKVVREKILTRAYQLDYTQKQNPVIPNYEALEEEKKAVRLDLRLTTPDQEKSIWKELDPILRHVAVTQAGDLVNDSRQLRQIVRNCYEIETKHPGLLKDLSKKYGFAPHAGITEKRLLTLDGFEANIDASLDHVQELTADELVLLSHAVSALNAAADIETSNRLVKALNRNASAINGLSKTGASEDIRNAATDLYREQRQGTQIISRAVERDIFLQRSTFAPEFSANPEAQVDALGTVLPVGVNPETCLASWTTHASPKIGENISRMNAVETKLPGASAFLQKEYGINNFERYPAEVLANQAEEESKDQPYGIILNPASDWNGAFSQHQKIWEGLSDQLGLLGYGLRIAEADSKFQVARRLLSLDKKFGSKNKISFAFVGGHGMKDGIQFGGPDARQELRIEDLKGKGVGRTSQFFEKQPTIMLVSCSTGVDNGIGQELSEVMGARVLAPTVPTNIKAIEVGKTLDNRPLFNVDYMDPQAKAGYTQGAKLSLE